MNARNILVVCPNRRMLSEVMPLVSQHLPLIPAVEMTVYPERTALQELLATKPPTLCLLDMATHEEYGFRTLQLMAALAPQVPVVVILNANNPDLILRCLRQGAAEFLLQPLSSEQILPVLERLSQVSGAGGSGANGGAKVHCVMPVKGACGSSTISTNLAYQWKRIGAKKILLADLDPTTGTQSFLLKLKSNYSFIDALSRAGNLDSDLWRGMVTPVSGIDVLLSPENAMDATHNLPDPEPVLGFCREAYEYVTIDCGGPYGPWATSMARLCDELLLVTTNELPALRATQRVLQVFDRQKIERSKIRLIVNRYNPDVGLNQEAIETVLHIDVFHVVPSDYEAVQKALVEGKPVAPGTGFGKSMVALADRLAGKTKTESKKSSSWVSLFSSFVSKVTS